jgi:hypothetical protein
MLGVFSCVIKLHLVYFGSKIQNIFLSANSQAKNKQMQQVEKLLHRDREHSGMRGLGAETIKTKL